MDSRHFLLTALCLSTAYANPLTKYLFNMATRGMDPLTRSLMQTTFGADMLDMDGGSGQSSYGYGSGMGGLGGMGGMGGMGGLGGLSGLGGFGGMNYYSPTISPMWNPSYFPSMAQDYSQLGSFMSNNLVQPSGISQGNPYNPSDDQNTQLVTSQSAAIGNPLLTTTDAGSLGGGGILGAAGATGQSFPFGVQQPFFNPLATSTPLATSSTSARNRLFNNFFWMRFMDAFDFF